MAVWLGMVPARAMEIRPLALRCEYLVNPQGIDTTAPRLSWQVASDQTVNKHD